MTQDGAAERKEKEEGGKTVHGEKLAPESGEKRPIFRGLLVILFSPLLRRKIVPRGTVWNCVWR
jgi:hypothetical protein